jgi:hypothetical protein
MRNSFSVTSAPLFEDADHSKGFFVKVNLFPLFPKTETQYYIVKELSRVNRQMLFLRNGYRGEL